MLWNQRRTDGSNALPGTYRLVLSGRSGNAVAYPVTSTMVVAPTATSPAGPCAEVDRIGDTERYSAAVRIGRLVSPTSRTIVLAPGADADQIEALVAAPLAVVKGGPRLLTAAASLPASVQTDIRTRKVTTAYLVGTTTQISTTVEKQLRSLGVTTVTRLAGADHYATAAAVATAMGRNSKAVVASLSGSSDTARDRSRGRGHRPPSAAVRAPGRRTGSDRRRSRVARCHLDDARRDDDRRERGRRRAAAGTHPRHRRGRRLDRGRRRRRARDPRLARDRVPGPHHGEPRARGRRRVVRCSAPRPRPPRSPAGWPRSRPSSTRSSWRPPRAGPTPRWAPSPRRSPRGRQPRHRRRSRPPRRSPTPKPTTTPKPTPKPHAASRPPRRSRRRSRPPRRCPRRRPPRSPSTGPASATASACRSTARAAWRSTATPAPRSCSTTTRAPRWRRTATTWTSGSTSCTASRPSTCARRRSSPAAARSR